MSEYGQGILASKEGTTGRAGAEEEEREGEGETTGNTFSVETDDEAIAGG